MRETGATPPYGRSHNAKQNSLKYGEIPHLDRNFGDAGRFGL
jgi:hypothetical protein